MLGVRRKRLLFAAALGLLAAAAVAVLLLKGPKTAPASDAAAAPAASPSGDAAPASTTAPAPPGEGEKKNGTKAPVPVNVAAVVSGSVSSYISTTANLVSENDVKVLAEAEGRVAALNVEEGDRVARGQVLATLVRDDAEIALKKAELRETNARLAHERAIKALEQDLLSREDFDKLTMEREVAQQELAEARWKLEKTTIRAPFAGRVTERIIRLGQHVRPPEHLFSVADFDPLIARIYLPEKDVLGLDEGREVRITMKASEAVQFAGRVRQISPVVDTGTGTVKVTVEAVRPPADVRPGAFVTIDIVRETHPRATLVPRLAVVRELQEAHIFVAEGEVARKRIITLGLEEGEHVEVLAGATAGEQVIVAGQGGLKDGSPIKVLPATEASDLAIAAGRPTHG
ncbi:MAG TPA: efflux RND transporter periplasmic adaptor subunit [Candidatus Polarisedimenticolia bacterium]|nr:efflux RND transporter periplasmic adaptor subunit [Candidatus Polarisedimenticolia bacterium]